MYLSSLLFLASSTGLARAGTGGGGVRPILLDGGSIQIGHGMKMLQDEDMPIAAHRELRDYLQQLTPTNNQRGTGQIRDGVDAELMDSEKAAI